MMHESVMQPTNQPIRNQLQKQQSFSKLPAIMNGATTVDLEKNVESNHNESHSQSHESQRHERNSSSTIDETETVSQSPSEQPHRRASENQSNLSKWSKVQVEMRRRTLHTTPSWFSVTMGTGITSVLLHELPYQFNGLRLISNLIFALNVVLFLIFLALSVARYTIWPRMFKIMIVHPSQSLFLGTFSMGLTTIVNMCALSASPSWGHRMVIFTWSLWWINLVICLSISIGLPFVQFTRHHQEFSKLTAVWLLPVVSPIVLAASGGTVAEILNPAQARLTLTISYILFGTGFPMAFMIMGLYYGRLAVYKIPPAALIVSVFLPLGPCGQGAFVLSKLSQVARDFTYSSGLPPLGGGPDLYSAETAKVMADALLGVSLPAALVIWGLGLVWFVIAVSTITDMALVSLIPFNTGFWAFTFPIGTIAQAATQFGKELDSVAFKVIGTILSVLVTLLWLVLIIITLYKAINGSLFFSPCLQEIGGEPPAYHAPTRKYDFKPREKKDLSLPGLETFSRSFSMSPFRGKGKGSRSPSKARARDQSEERDGDESSTRGRQQIDEVIVRA